jgi:regulator of replication initiation timing
LPFDHPIENEVELKSNIIRKRDKEIVEKEREVWDAIEESNRLRLKLDTLQQQHSETMVEDKEMSKKIEILEDELIEKENAIMNSLSLLRMIFDLSSTSFSRSFFSLVSSPISFSTNKRSSLFLFICFSRDKFSSLNCFSWSSATLR